MRHGQDPAGNPCVLDFQPSVPSPFKTRSQAVYSSPSADSATCKVVYKITDRKRIKNFNFPENGQSRGLDLYFARDCQFREPVLCRRICQMVSSACSGNWKDTQYFDFIKHEATLDCRLQFGIFQNFRTHKIPLGPVKIQIRKRGLVPGRIGPSNLL